jgi:hypothetical protein
VRALKPAKYSLTGGMIEGAIRIRTPLWRPITHSIPAYANNIHSIDDPGDATQVHKLTRGRLASVAAMRRDHLDAVLSQLRIQRIGPC